MNIPKILILAIPGVVTTGLVVGISCLFLWNENIGKKISKIFIIPYLIINILPTGPFMIHLLENRFPPLTIISNDITGLILLGGGFDLHEINAKNYPLYNPDSARLFHYITLIYTFPDKKFFVTGTPQETAQVKKIIEMFKVPPVSVNYDEKAQNTIDNAKGSFEKIQPKASEKWILVTSAYHMARAVGTFRGMGWRVIPYPVNYLTPHSNRFFRKVFIHNRQAGDMFSIALKEFLGMGYNYLTDKSPELYPTSMVPG